MLSRSLAAVFCSLILLFSAGSSAAAPPSTELRFRLVSDPSTVDWNLAGTSYETYIVMNLMEGLVEEGPDLRPRPALAEKWEISPDGKTYTFYLRSGVKWSDGRALRAQDFVDSWIRLLDPKTGSSYASFLFDVENAEAFHSGKVKDPSRVGVKALGSRVFQVRLKRVLPYFLHLPTFWVTFPIRADLIKKYGKAWTAPGKIVVLGPYTLKQWVKGKYIRLDKNPSYFDAKSVFVDHVLALIEPDDGNARKLFEQGKLDFLLDATTDDLFKARSGTEGAIRVAQYPYLATYYLGTNVHFGPLRNVLARKAIAGVIDRTQIPALLQGGQIPAPSWVPPGVMDVEPRQMSPLIGLARKELAQAGFGGGKGFPKLALWVEKFDRSELIAQLIADALRDKLGVNTAVFLASSSQFRKAVKSGKAALFVTHWGADFPDPANLFEVFQTGSGFNYTGWKNKEYDNYLAIARKSQDSSVRLAAYRAAEKILIDKDAVILPLFYKKNTALLGPRIRDFRISPLNYLFFKTIRLQMPMPR